MSKKDNTVIISSHGWLAGPGTFELFQEAGTEPPWYTQRVARFIEAIFPNCRIQLSGGRVRAITSRQKKTRYSERRMQRRSTRTLPRSNLIRHKNLTELKH